MNLTEGDIRNVSLVKYPGEQMKIIGPEGAKYMVFEQGTEITVPESPSSFKPIYVSCSIKIIKDTHPDQRKGVYIVKLIETYHPEASKLQAKIGFNLKLKDASLILKAGYCYEELVALHKSDLKGFWDRVKEAKKDV